MFIGLAYELHKDAVDHLAFIEALRKEFKVQHVWAIWP